jgi:hypothetical protein
MASRRTWSNSRRFLKLPRGLLAGEMTMQVRNRFSDASFVSSACLIMPPKSDPLASCGLASNF